MIIKIGNFLAEDERNDLLRYARMLTAQDRWNYSDMYNEEWYNRCMDISMLDREDFGFGLEIDIKIKEILERIRVRMAEEIMRAHSLDKEIYADCVQLVRWPEGSSQGVHSDSAYESGGDHPSPWRVYSAIVYLNDDYDGGNTYFPQHDLSVIPKAGSLLTFPCTLEYMHGVSEVKNRTRFTIATFWTYDKNKEI